MMCDVATATHSHDGGSHTDGSAMQQQRPAARQLLLVAAALQLS